MYRKLMVTFFTIVLCSLLFVCLTPNKILASNGPLGTLVFENDFEDETPRRIDSYLEHPPYGFTQADIDPGCWIEIVENSSFAHWGNKSARYKAGANGGTGYCGLLRHPSYESKWRYMYISWWQKWEAPLTVNTAQIFYTYSHGMDKPGGGTYKGYNNIFQLYLYEDGDLRISGMYNKIDTEFDPDPRKWTIDERIDSVVTPGIWYHFEVEVAVEKTSGKIIVKLDGNDLFRYENIDTYPLQPPVELPSGFEIAYYMPRSYSEEARYCWIDDVEFYAAATPQINAVLGSTPTVDGQIHSAEWSDASEELVDENTTLYVKQNGVNLYVCFNLSDSTYSQSDYAAIYIDVDWDRNSSLRDDDVALVVYRNGTMVERNGAEGVWDAAVVTGWNALVHSASDFWQAEFSITYQKINVIAGVDTTLGAAFSKSNEGSSSSTWPSNGFSSEKPSTWGEIASPEHHWIPEVDLLIASLFFTVFSLLAVMFSRRFRSSLQIGRINEPYPTKDFN